MEGPLLEVSHNSYTAKLTLLASAIVIDTKLYFFGGGRGAGKQDVIKPQR